MPSLIGGFALGSLFAISAVRIKDGLDYGYETAGEHPFHRLGLSMKGLGSGEADEWAGLRSGSPLLLPAGTSLLLLLAGAPRFNKGRAPKILSTSCPPLEGSEGWVAGRRKVADTAPRLRSLLPYLTFFERAGQVQLNLS